MIASNWRPGVTIRSCSQEMGLSIRSRSTSVSRHDTDERIEQAAEQLLERIWMVVGIDRFRDHFAGHDHQYVLIGGAACYLVMGGVGLDFRATKDLDIVLLVEALDPAFSERFWAFVEEGGYQIRERSEGERILYRFQKPAKPDFPAMLELFSRNPEGLTLAAGKPADSAADRRGGGEPVSDPARRGLLSVPEVDGPHDRRHP